jgi:hypothetical protein
LLPEQAFDKLVTQPAQKGSAWHINAAVVLSKQEARATIEWVDRIDAPGILWGVAPWTHLPAGSIGDLHRACRPLLAKELIPMIENILRSWCDDELLVDVSQH